MDLPRLKLLEEKGDPSSHPGRSDPVIAADSEKWSTSVQ
jgi:hypothetical protein